MTSRSPGSSCSSSSRRSSFTTPTSPRSAPPPASALVELRTVAPGQIATYRVDARLLAPLTRTPELEHDLHETVQKNVQDLNHGRFEIVRIDPIRGEGGTIAYYDVSVKP